MCTKRARPAAQHRYVALGMCIIVTHSSSTTCLPPIAPCHIDTKFFGVLDSTAVDIICITDKSRLLFVVYVVKFDVNFHLLVTPRTYGTHNIIYGVLYEPRYATDWCCCYSVIPHIEVSSSKQLYAAACLLLAVTAVVVVVVTGPLLLLADEVRNTPEKERRGLRCCCYYFSLRNEIAQARATGATQKSYS